METLGSIAFLAIMFVSGLTYLAMWLFGVGLVVLVCVAIAVVALRIIQWGLRGLGTKPQGPTAPYITPTQFLERTKR